MPSSIIALSHRPRSSSKLSKMSDRRTEYQRDYFDADEPPSYAPGLSSATVSTKRGLYEQPMHSAA